MAYAMLKPVDGVDVTVLVDNAIDILLPGNERVTRAPLSWEWSMQEQLRAEHGYSLLLTVHHHGRSQSILYDAGLGRSTILHNMDVLGLRANELRAIVLSHGHADHHGGLEGLIQRSGRRGMPLVLHPDVWKDRKVVFPTGVEIHMPPPNRNDLDREGVQVIEERRWTLLIDGTVLVTGQVDRVTAFEQGFPFQLARSGGGWAPDTWIWDDQAVVVHVEGKGLVVLSSCSHAGSINILRYAQKLTGVEQIHAFIGGMHLTGGVFEKIIPQTVEQLEAIRPDIIMPGHCTGLPATIEIARRFGGSFIQSSVGTTVHLA